MKLYDLTLKINIVFLIKKLFNLANINLMFTIMKKLIRLYDAPPDEQETNPDELTPPRTGGGTHP